MHKKLTPLLLLALFFSITATAQPRKIGSPVVRNFTREEYKAGPQNWAIDQDEKGRLYFGNNDGLLMYDGTFRLFPLPNKTIVRSMAYDKNSRRVYVGGQGTFGFFKRNGSGSFEYSCLSDSLAKQEDRDFEDVWRIFLDDADNSILFTTYKMIVRYRQGQPPRAYRPQKGDLEFAFSIRGNIYAWQPGIGLVELRADTFHVVNGGDVFSQDKMSVKAILPFDGDTKLIATEQKGLYKFDGRNSPTPWLENMTGFFEEVVINTGAMLQDGNYAFATKLNGVVIIERATGNMIAQLDKDHGLPNDNVIAIKQSADKNLWLGLHNGLARADINSLWNFVFVPPYTQIGAHGSVLFKNKLYLVTPNGLFVKEFKEHEVLGKEFTAVKGTEGEAWNLSEVHDTLFLGHHNGAYCICSDGRLEQIDTIKGYWKFLAVPGRSDLLLAGNYSGLVLFEKSPGSPCGWKKLKDFPGESSRIMEFDKNGTTLWMTHVYKGVWKLDFKPDYSDLAQKPFHFGKTNLNGLPSLDKINVFKIDDGVVFGTENGVYSYGTSNVFGLDNKFLKIFGDTAFVSFMVQDSEDNIWFWANGKPGKLRKTAAGYERVNFPELGFLDGNFKSNFEHINPLRGGGILFGTADGFFKYGANPSVPVIPPTGASTKALPTWISIFPWVLAAVLTGLFLFVYWWCKKKVVIEPSKAASSLSLLIEHGYENCLKDLEKKLRTEKHSPESLFKELDFFQQSVAPSEKQLALYEENRSWVKALRVLFSKAPDTFWKVAVSAKNGMNEDEICQYLNLSKTTVKDRHLKDLHVYFGTKDMNALRQKLSNFHKLQIDDIQHLPLQKVLNQIKTNLYLPFDELANLINSRLSNLAPFDKRLMAYADEKPWLRKLQKDYPGKLNQKLLVTCIGIRNVLTDETMATLTEYSVKQMEHARKNLRDIFTLPDGDALTELIENYPDE
ncbi:MAG: hypothetical protein HUU34_08495 [Saprospiraceae bacterium]|nr:hypothetical protein [Saprospiraceae bacterium]